MKIENWKQKIIDNNELSIAIEIIEIIVDIGYEAYIVGGFVRDLILGIKSSDIDISSNVTEKNLSEFFDIVDVGASKSFGVFVIKYKGFVFEIAQYRADIYDNIFGNGADTVKIVQSYKDDAARRDLTINAFGLDKDGDVVDYFGGLYDIQNKIINTVGNAYDRFEEDYIRMLRVVRFSIKLGFKIHGGVIEAIQDNAHNIVNVAPERIMKELKKMAGQSGSKFADAIKILIDTGLLKYILPEIIKMDDFEHSVEHHPEGNVLQHTFAALRNSDSINPVVNLSILFHDIGKILTHSISDNGMHQYLKHAKAAEGLINTIANRLNLDNKTKDSLLYAAMNHMKIHEFLKLNPKTAIDLINNPNWDVLMSVAKADAMARGELFDASDWDKIEDRVEKLKEKFKGKQAIDNIKKVVNGNLIMKLRPDIKPSPKLGEIIKKSVEWIVNNNINIDDIEKISEFIKIA